MSTIDSVFQNLERLRAEAGVSIEDVCFFIQAHPQTYKRWRRGFTPRSTFEGRLRFMTEMIEYCLSHRFLPISGKDATDKRTDALNQALYELSSASGGRCDV